MVAEWKTKEQKLARIAEIDKMFDEATGWGSWMLFAFKERRWLVCSLKDYDGVVAEHKHEIRIG